MLRTLAEWLDFQQRQHPREIELGLVRVAAVHQRLGAARPAPVVITVGGTNGKGSTVALLEAMLRAAGYRTGAYTSPHLQRYNERVRIDGVESSDAMLVESFQRIEAARSATPLTYFEYGTLAAFDLFARARLDVAVLEVGLGGRLDAVNLVDADAAVVTTIDLDHQDWLGPDRDSIAVEKAGIFRHGRPAVIGDAEAPARLVAEATRVGAVLQRAGIEFAWQAPEGDERDWHWRHIDGTRYALPPPALRAPAQRANAAAAIAALHALRAVLALDAAAMRRGIAETVVPGRLQHVHDGVEIVLDVGHNPQAARQIAQWLREHPGPGRTLAVFAALGDKDIGGIAAAVAPHISQWHLAALDRETPRGLDAEALRQRLLVATPAAPVALHPDVAAALHAARASAAATDRIVVFGSFHTVAAALRALQPAAA